MTLHLVSGGVNVKSCFYIYKDKNTVSLLSSFYQRSYREIIHHLRIKAVIKLLYLLFERFRHAPCVVFNSELLSETFTYGQYFWIYAFDSLILPIYYRCNIDLFHCYNISYVFSLLFQLWLIFPFCFNIYITLNQLLSSSNFKYFFKSW